MPERLHCLPSEEAPKQVICRLKCGDTACALLTLSHQSSGTISVLVVQESILWLLDWVHCMG